MARYDIAYHVDISAEPDAFHGNYLVLTSANVLYYVYISNTTFDIYWIKSSDGGLSWSTPALIKAATIETLAVWYDRWSSGSGTTIHIAYIDSSSNDVFYRALDTSTDTLGSEITVFAGASVSGAPALSITKARGGNILVYFDLDGGTEAGFYRSTDGGGTFGSRASPNEAVLDYVHLGPGFAADNQDIIAIFWDRSASEISRKLYDDSANSWSETSIAASMTSPVATTDNPYFAIATDLTNSRLLLCAWSNRDSANADLRFWQISEAAISEGGNVVLNSTDDQGMCTIALNTSNSAIYVFYGGKSDGSETMNTAIKLYYKVSTDAGLSWGSETTLSTFPASTYLHMTCSPHFTTDFATVAHLDITAATGHLAVFNVSILSAIIVNEITHNIVDPDYE